MSAASHFLQRHGLRLALLLALLVFLPALGNGFAYDDVPIVENNPRVQSVAGWGSLWSADYWDHTGGKDLLYRPVTLQSLAFDWQLGDGSPFPFHLVNLLLFVAVTWLVHGFARSLCDDPAVAAVAALLFAVHPLHTEVTSSVVGRADLLVALCTLLSLRWVRGNHLWPAALMAFAAMGSKENGLAVVPLALLCAWHWRGPSPRSLLVPFGVALLAYLLLRWTACGALLGSGGPERFSNPIVALEGLPRLLAPFALLGRYLWLFVFPRDLCPDYSLGVDVLPAGPGDPFALAGLGLSAAAAVALWRGRRGGNVNALCVAWALLAYGIVSNLVVLIGTTMAERLFFLPTVALCVLAARPLTALLQRGTAAGIVVLGLLLLAGAGWTAVRSTDWQSNETVAARGFAVHPEGARIRYGRGLALLERAQGYAGADAEVTAPLFAEAAKLLQEAVEQYGWNADWWQKLGLAWRGARNYDRALIALTAHRSMIGPMPLGYPMEFYFRLVQTQRRAPSYVARAFPEVGTELQVLMELGRPGVDPLRLWERFPRADVLAVEQLRARWARGGSERQRGLRQLQDFVQRQVSGDAAGAATAMTMLARLQPPAAGAELARRALQTATEDPFLRIIYAEALLRAGDRSGALALYDELAVDDHEPYCTWMARSRRADLLVRGDN